MGRWLRVGGDVATPAAVRREGAGVGQELRVEAPAMRWGDDFLPIQQVKNSMNFADFGGCCWLLLLFSPLYGGFSSHSEAS